MGSMQRQKGKAGERELSQKLRDLGHTNARRGVQYHGGPDSPDVVGVAGVHIECKRTETLSVYAAMAQAVEDVQEYETMMSEITGLDISKVPAVAHRRSRKDWLLILRLDDVTEFCRRWLASLEQQAADAAKEQA